MSHRLSQFNGISSWHGCIQICRLLLDQECTNLWPTPNSVQISTFNLDHEEKHTRASQFRDPVHAISVYRVALYYNYIYIIIVRGLARSDKAKDPAKVESLATHGKKAHNCTFQYHPQSLFFVSVWGAEGSAMLLHLTSVYNMLISSEKIFWLLWIE